MDSSCRTRNGEDATFIDKQIASHVCTRETLAMTFVLDTAYPCTYNTGRIPR